MIRKRKRKRIVWEITRPHLGMVGDSLTLKGAMAYVADRAIILKKTKIRKDPSQYLVKTNEGEWVIEKTIHTLLPTPQWLQDRWPKVKALLDEICEKEGV